MPDVVPPPVKDPHNISSPEDPSAKLSLGGRVSVRYRLPHGAEAGATDAVGSLVQRDDETLVIETRKGTVTVRRSEVVAARDVPPRPTRPGPAHQRISADDLEAVMAEAWPAVERESLGSWSLRSSSGFTGRACSVLPMGDPGLPLDRAIEQVERWYADRGQPPMFQVYGPPGFAIADVPLAAALLRRGYAVGGRRADWVRVLVMTGPTSAVPPVSGPSLPVAVEERMSAEWLDAYGQGRPAVPGATEAVLAGRDGLRFLSVRDAGAGLIGIGRLALQAGWAGVFAVWVEPSHRRRGVARALTSTMATIARQHGIPSLYLQVSADNAAAIRLYEELGFTVHHEYTYLTPVGPPAE
jgi:GNAT superfamily N-acetyltransferase